MKKVDENKAMVVSQTKEVKHHADELSKVLGKHKNIESWVVGKIERASTDLSDVTHYLDGKKYAKGGEVEDKKKSILNYINTFPNKPKDWSEATDELPTIHKEMAEIYTDKGNKYDFDFTKRSSLEERNLRHKKGIKFLLNKFSDKDINDIYNSYYHWFKYQYENGGELNNNCEYTIGGL